MLQKYPERRTEEATNHTLEIFELVEVRVAEMVEDLLLAVWLEVAGDSPGAVSPAPEAAVQAPVALARPLDLAGHVPHPVEPGGSRGGYCALRSFRNIR